MPHPAPSSPAVDGREEVARNPRLRFVFIVIAPLACVVVMALSAPRVPSAWRGYEGHGQVGIATVTFEDCGKGGCDYAGTFDSDDGKVRLRNIGISGLYHHVGQRFQAYYTGDPDSVYVKGSGDVFIYGFAVFAASTYLVIWAAFLGHKWRRRRRGTSPEVSET